MAYLEIDTKQGTFLVDTDKVLGVGQASVHSESGLPILAVFLSMSGSVDLYLHSQEQADKVLDEIKKLIIQRKIRTPMKPIVIKGAE